MSHSVKFAISLPAEEFRNLESYRKKTGLSRSRFILEALRLWKKAKKTERLIRTYEDGYKRMPENAARAEAWEKASLEIFSNEDW